MKLTRSPVSHELGQPVVLSSLLAKLIERRTGQRRLGDAGEMLGRDVDRFVELAAFKQQLDQDLGCRQGVSLFLTLDLLTQLTTEMRDSDVGLAADQCVQIRTVVVEDLVEGGRAVEDQPRRKASAVGGQVDRHCDRLAVPGEQRHPHDGRQVGDVDVVGVIGEEPGAAGDQAGDGGALRGHDLAAVGDLGADSR